MEFTEKLSQFAQRIENIKDSISTEEATKTSMIMPFFQMLGYDVFNPLEFVPEFTADVGIKKGEKVDYAIIVDNNPLILIECKPCSENLDKHGSQLFRYFGTTTASKFAILTNGITYRFYTDLEDKNKMDSTPFLTVDLLNLKDRDIVEFKKFTKEALDVDNILSSASDLKYSRLIKEWLANELDNPSIELVKLVLNNVFDGMKSQKTIDKFTPLIKRSMQQFINESMNAKIKTALNKEQIDDYEAPTSDQEASENVDDMPEHKIETTMEELEACAVIKSILRKIVDSNRVTYRDTESYLGILLDNNNRKWICRVHILSAVKYITISDENKKPIRYDIDSIDDIYKYDAQIIESCQRYL